MRIALAPSAFHPHRGGVENLTGALAWQLQDRGHEVIVVTQRHPASLPVHETVDGVTVHRLSFETPSRSVSAIGRFLASQRAVRRQLDAALQGAAVVHLHCASSQTLPVALWARSREVPLVMTTHGEVSMDSSQLYQRSAYARATFRVGSRTAAAVTACSHWTATNAARLADAFDGCLVIPPGVDPSAWRVGPRPTEPHFCAWGRLVHEKGFDRLLDAFALLRQRLPEARLRLGGEGPERAALEARGGGGVQFLGPLDQDGVRALLRASSVAVVPSRTEPFGIVALEALAAERALVHSGVGGLGEAAGGHGLRVDADDPEAFADGLLQALSVGVSDEVQSHVLDHSWERMTERYLAVYRRVGAVG